MGARRALIRQEDVTQWSRVASATKRGLALGFFVLLGWSGIAQASAGSDWLASQQQTDGSISNGPALVDPVQSTAEALLAFQALGETTRPGFPAALSFLSQGVQNNVRYLARLVMINAKAGVDTTALVNTLMSYQNLDGGFGFQVGYQSSVLDTAYALEGLARANYISSLLAPVEI